MLRPEQIGFPSSLWGKYVTFKGSRWRYGCSLLFSMRWNSVLETVGSRCKCTLQGLSIGAHFFGGYNLILYLPGFKMQILLTEWFYFFFFFFNFFKIFYIVWFYFFPKVYWHVFKGEYIFIQYLFTIAKDSKSSTCPLNGELVKWSHIHIADSFANC